MQRCRGQRASVLTPAPVILTMGMIRNTAARQAFLFKQTYAYRLVTFEFPTILPSDTLVTCRFEYVPRANSVEPMRLQMQRKIRTGLKSTVRRVSYRASCANSARQYCPPTSACWRCPHSRSVSTLRTSGVCRQLCMFRVPGNQCCQALHVDPGVIPPAKQWKLPIYLRSWGFSVFPRHDTANDYGKTTESACFE